MKNVRRYYRPGQQYFLTHVTHNRNPILVENHYLLLEAINTVATRIRFTLHAWVILPDHWHCILEPTESDPGRIVKNIKISFAAKFRRRHGGRAERVWHNRFWDHIIRDDEDFARHLDYIHANPCKHGIVNAPWEYPYSTFQQHVLSGVYERDWGRKRLPELTGDFGE